MSDRQYWNTQNAEVKEQNDRSTIQSSKPKQNILEYLKGSRYQSGDVLICCSNGNLSAHKLVLASISQILFLEFSLEQRNSEDSAILILPDFTTEAVSRYLDAVYGCEDLTRFSELNKMVGFQLAVHFLPSIELPPVNGNLKKLIPEVKLEEYENCFNEEVGEKKSPIAIENNSTPKQIRTKKSIVWKHFSKDPNDESLCSCHICGKSVVSNNYNTSNMMNHLVVHHGIAKTELSSSHKERKTKAEGEEELEEVKKPKQTRKKRSPVWEHFVKDLTDPGGTVCICQICQKVVHSINYNTTNLIAHLSSAHGIGQRENESFMCSICGKTFNLKGHRDRHERQHNKQYSFFCSFCGKGFIENNNRKIHERIHTGEKPYQVMGLVGFNSLVLNSFHSFQCTLCGKQVSQQHQLKTHMRVHTGETPYQCPKCLQRFKFLATRNNHKCVETSQR